MNSALPTKPLSLSDRASDAHLFVGTLFPFKMNAYVELRAFSDKPTYRDWVPVQEATYLDYESLLSKLETSHTYVGMAARRVHGAGTRDGCYAMTSVFIDGDFKTVEQINQFATDLKTFPLQATMVVRSGSGWGLHVYWCLTDPYVVMDSGGKINPEMELLYQRVQLGLAQHFKADHSVQDLPRVMRLPGSRNIKPHNGPGAIVQLLRCHPKNRYQISDFAPWLAEESDVQQRKEMAPVRPYDPDDPDSVDLLAEFSRRGWVIEDQGDEAYYVRCPWIIDHTNVSGPSETLLWNWQGRWCFNCFHSHCKGRRVAQVYAYFRLMRTLSTGVQ